MRASDIYTESLFPDFSAACYNPLKNISFQIISINIIIYYGIIFD
jgi:hypothetical protein